MDAPLARHLARFSAHAVVIAAPAIVVEQDAAPERSVTMTVSAYESGLREAAETARTKAEAEAAAALERTEAAHATALAEGIATAEARWALAAGDAVAAQIDAALTMLRDEIAAQVADALRPLLAEAVVDRATTAVAQTLARAVADPDHPALAVRGPGSIVAAVQARLGETSGVSFVSSDEAALVVTGNGVRIETRLAQALATLGVSEEPA